MHHHTQDQQMRPDIQPSDDQEVTHDMNQDDY